MKRYLEQIQFLKSKVESKWLNNQDNEVPIMLLLFTRKLFCFFMVLNHSRATKNILISEILEKNLQSETHEFFKICELLQIDPQKILSKKSFKSKDILNQLDISTSIEMINELSIKIKKEKYIHKKNSFNSIRILNNSKLEFNFIKLEKRLDKFHRKYMLGRCYLCKKYQGKKQHVLCLLCGKLVCFTCNEDEKGVSFNMGSLTHHATIEHGGNTLYSKLEGTNLIVLHGTKIKKTFGLYSNQLSMNVVGCYKGFYRTCDTGEIKLDENLLEKMRLDMVLGNFEHLIIAKEIENRRYIPYGRL